MVLFLYRFSGAKAVKRACYFFLRGEVFLAFADDFFFLPSLNALSKFDEYLGVEPMRKMVTWCFLASNCCEIDCLCV
jgi:hypothetical protein